MQDDDSDGEDLGTVYVVAYVKVGEGTADVLALLDFMLITTATGKNADLL